MSTRNRLVAWLPLVALLALLSAPWALAAPPVGPGGPDPQPVLARNPGPEIVISARDSEEHLPAIAFNPNHNEYLVVWENDWGGGYHDIYAQRISASGKLLSWFALPAAPDRSQISPAVAYDPDRDRYLVVFALDYHGDGSDWDLYGRFVPWNGPPDPSAIPICGLASDQRYPAVAYGRSQGEYLVVWKDTPDEVVSDDIVARRVRATDGVLLGDPFTLSSDVGNRGSPDIAYNLHRNEYLVAWDLEIDPGDNDIRGIRLRGDGAPLTGGNPPQVGAFIIADFIGANEWTAAVAACAAADQYLVAWQSDQGSGGADHAIYARYLNGDAMPGNIVLIDDTSYPELNVDVDCNTAGDRYVLAWQRGSSSLKYGIWARFARPNESLSALLPVRYPGASTDRVFPAVAGGRIGALVAWEHQRDSDGNRDIHARLLQYMVYAPFVCR